MTDIPCYMEVDERTSTVTLRHPRTRCVLMKFKMEAGTFGTITRMKTNEDCDNYWIALKPADSTVFDDELFSPKKVIVEAFSFRIE